MRPRPAGVAFWLHAHLPGFNAGHPQSVYQPGAGLFTFVGSQRPHLVGLSPQDWFSCKAWNYLIDWSHIMTWADAQTNLPDRARWYATADAASQEATKRCEASALIFRRVTCCQSQQFPLPSMPPP